MAYHYRDSGLDNVFLENGFTLHQTPYGEGISIQDTEGLHKAIGQWLIAEPKPLNGAELRFLRIEMELTQRDLAIALGTTEQTLLLWEKHRRKPMHGSADRLLRMLYSEFIGMPRSARETVERLAAPDLGAEPAARPRDTDQGWMVEHAEAA